MKLLFRILVLGILITTTLSCSDDDDGGGMTPDLPNLVDAAQDAGLTTLLNAVGAVDGLDQTLLDADEITVFAPTNEAFGAALEAFDAEDLSGLVEAIGGTGNLGTVLGFHVVPAVAFAGDLAEGEQTFDTLAGQELTVTKNGDSVSVTDSNGNTYNVVTPDVEIKNGVVHAINGVILPELPDTITDLALGNDNLSSLVAALEYTGLDETLADRSAEFTVFAPTNDAFTTFLDGAALEDLDKDVVRQVLLNHVLTGNRLSTSLKNGYVKTNATENYSGSEDDNFIDMYVYVDDDVTLNDSATVTNADLEADNGTVHVVDEVITIPNVVDLADANPQFSNLTKALEQEDLISVLSTDVDTSPAPFTVFAPNNSAFDNFIDSNDDFNNIQGVLDFNRLSDVLKYHVLPDGGVRAGDITDGIMPETVQGDTVTINTTDDGVTITDQDERVTNIVATNVTGSNGVIHILDNLILPRFRAVGGPIKIQ